MHAFSHSVRTSLLTAGLMLALSGSVLAQSAPSTPTAGPAHEGQRAEKMHQRMQQRHAQHLNALKAKLKLSAEQESSWKTFSDAMQAPGSGPGARLGREGMEKLSTPERIDHMQAMHAQREQQMKQRGEATKAFYAGLSAEQKKTFDAETARMMSRSGKGDGHGMHGHGHKHF